jgi:tetratricopeptide (TPR) repeat protein
MRTLLFVFALIFAGSVMAQSPMVSRSFNDATRSANAGEFEKALTGYRLALIATEGEPGEFAVKIHYNLGVCHYRLGQLTAARSEFTTAIRLAKGQHQRALYALGMTESALENWPAARRAFLNVLDIDPADGEAWFDLAFVYLAERDYDNVAKAFRKAIENKSVDSALGHNNIGVIMAMKNDLASAEKEFEAALLRSGGRLVEARKNLEFCRTLSTRRRELIGESEFIFALRRMQIVLA